MKTFQVQLQRLDRNKILIILLWTLGMIVVNPIGDFPLNDDWAYGKNVFHLSEQGILKFSDWPAMTLIAQMLWGAFYTTIFGFSFTVLRLSVLLLGILGTLSFYNMVLKIAKNKQIALLASLTLAANPLFFSLSFSFMTDVPFLVSSILSLLFFSKHIQNPCKLRFFIWATIFAIIATLIRQIGIILPLAALTAVICSYGWRNRRFILYLASSVATILILLLFIKWLEVSGNLSKTFSGGSELLRENDFVQITKTTWFRSRILLLYFGLFLLPLLLYSIHTYIVAIGRRKSVYLAIVAILLSLFTITVYDLFPTGNVWHDWGLGPKVLKDTYWGYNIKPVAGNHLWMTIKIAGTIGAALLLFMVLAIITHAKTIIKKLRNKTGSSEPEFIATILGDKSIITIKLMALAIISAYWIFLVLGIYFFDRYHLFLIPFLIIIVIPVKPKSWEVTNNASFFLLSMFSIFSFFATHDYLSWNRTRWKALNGLTQQGISPSAIDGGFEFNGWFETGPRRPDTPHGKSWWFVNDDVFLIAFGDVCGFKKSGAYEYSSYLTLSNDSLFILKRISPTPENTLVYFCNAEQDSVNHNTTYLKPAIGNVLFGGASTMSTNTAYSGKQSILLTKKNCFGFSISIDSIMGCEDFQVRVLTKNNHGNANLVAAAPKTSDFYVSKSIDKDSGDWQLISLNFSVSRQPSYNKLSFYVWLHSGDSVYFDDFRIDRIRY